MQSAQHMDIDWFSTATRARTHQSMNQYKTVSVALVLAISLVMGCTGEHSGASQPILLAVEKADCESGLAQKFRIPQVTCGGNRWEVHWIHTNCENPVADLNDCRDKVIDFYNPDKNPTQVIKDYFALHGVKVIDSNVIGNDVDGSLLVCPAVCGSECGEIELLVCSGNQDKLLRWGFSMPTATDG